MTGVQTILLDGLPPSTNSLWRHTRKDGKPVTYRTKRYMTWIKASGWQVKEQDNFPADAAKIRQFLVKLTDQKIEHLVTSKKDRLGEFGLLTQEENKGKFDEDKVASTFVVEDGQGESLFSVLFGNDRRTAGSVDDA